MNRIWLGILLLLGSLCSASAQELLPIVVSSCGTPPTTYSAGRAYQPTMDTTGTLCTGGGGGSGGTSSTFGHAFPSAGTAIGLSNGTNMVALTLGQAAMASSIPVVIASDQSAVPVTGSGSAGTAASGVVTVQGIGGGTAIPISGSISANATYTGAITNPTSTLTRPANTTPYSVNNIVASSTTAGSIVVPSFAIANSAGGAIVPRIRINTNVTTGWGAVNLLVTLWTTAPTYTNGDGSAYAVATGSANRVGQYQVTLTQNGDGAAGEGMPNVGNAASIKLASGTAVYWDIQILTAATPISGQTFTITPELLN